VLLTEIMDHATGEPVMALLNNRPWETDDVERPRVDTLEQWNIVNLTAHTHSIHLHLVQFLVRDRQLFDAGRYMRSVFGKEELGHADVGAGERPFPAPRTFGPPLRPRPGERGWKDTVQAHPRTVTRILVPFGPGAAPGVPFGFDPGPHTMPPGHECDCDCHHMWPLAGEYVWHCHILDHEDNEMMAPLEVVR
jgi:FtsP/CotA-like multicopper oxidase with cupredoxin domain